MNKNVIKFVGILFFMITIINFFAIVSNATLLASEVIKYGDGVGTSAIDEFRSRF